MTLLHSFIATADRVGLPVKMLQYVQARYDIGTTSRARGVTNTRINFLWLNRDKAAALRSAVVGGRLAEGVLEFEDDHLAVAELYHEATHAYFDLKLEEAYTLRKATTPVRLIGGGAPQKEAQRVESVMKEAVKHYEIAWLEGKPAPVQGKGWNIAHEAAAMYIAQRASAYWQALDWLVYCRDSLKRMLGSKGVDGPRKAEETKTALNKAQTRYNNAMKDLVHGYFEAGVIGMLFPEPRFVVGKEIPRTMKELCDDILEQKIPDNFSSSRTMVSLTLEINPLIARLRAINS